MRSGWGFEFRVKGVGIRDGDERFVFGAWRLGFNVLSEGCRVQGSQWLAQCSHLLEYELLVLWMLVNLTCRACILLEVLPLQQCC